MPRTTPQKIEGASGAPLRPRAEGDPLVARFLSAASSERGDSPNTLLGYARDLGQFAEFTWGSASEPPYPWKAVGKDDARAFLVGLSRSDAAPTTVRRKLSALRSFYAHLVREGEIADSPLAMLRGPKRRRELPDVLSVAEVETLLETAREAARRAEAERTPADASIERAYLAWRDWALLEFLYGTGARIAPDRHGRTQEVARRVERHHAERVSGDAERAHALHRLFARLRGEEARGTHRRAPPVLGRLFVETAGRVGRLVGVEARRHARAAHAVQRRLDATRSEIVCENVHGLINFT